MSGDNPFKKIKHDKYDILDNNREVKPIDTIKGLVDVITSDVAEIKNDIQFIKQYIRKIEIRKEIEEQEALKVEEEYVKTSWW